MKSGHKAIGFSLILIGIASNPWALSKLFSTDGEITTRAVFTSIFSLELLIVFFGVLVWKAGSKLFSNIGLIVFTTWLTVAFSVLTDRVYGTFFMPEKADLLFPAFTVAEHNTSEFDLNVHINNLGFRGANTSIEKTRKRIILIGDSFTFGWGVEENETWVHLLSQKYPEIEFLNLGQGGNHPGDYVQIAKRSIPVLNPDLIMVGILQGNDIHQLMRVIEYEETGNPKPKPEQTPESNQARLWRYLDLVFPNFTKRFPAKVSIHKRWKNDAASLREGLDKNQLVRYESLNAEIRNDFESGLLNPSLIYESIHHPNMFHESVDTANVQCRKAIIRLRDHISELKNTAKANSSEIILLSLPNRPYGLPNTPKPLAKLGFSVSGCDTLDGDLPTSLANWRSGITLIDRFTLSSNSPVFYQYDGHWNAHGNRIFAEQLIQKLNSLPQWKHFLTSSSF